MSITYQIEPVIEVVRSFIDRQMTVIGNPVVVLPTLTAVSQYPFEPSLCPLLVLEPVATSADWRKYAAGDVTLSLDLNIHQIRKRSGVAGGEETAAIQTLCVLAAAFATDYRLDGNVQSVMVESVALAEPGTLHRVGIPLDEHVVFAAATMKMKVYWVESCFV
jgi:hypothetical protein